MSSIPPYRDFVLPFLQILNDRELYTTDGIINNLVILFGLSMEDMKEMVKSEGNIHIKIELLTQELSY